MLMLWKRHDVASQRKSGPSPHRFASFRLLTLFTLALVFGTPAAMVHGQTQDKVIAVVNGRNITERDVDESVAAQILPLQQQIYAIRKAALENLISRAVLEGEAQRRGISVEELRKQLTAGQVEVLPSEVEREYLENASAFGTMSPDEAKEKLRLDLESRMRLRNYHEALLKLKESSHIKSLLDEPTPITVSGDAAASTGSEDAAVTITEFSDFQCPYCRQAQETVKQILRNYGKNVRLVFKHLPLDIHENAFASAQAAFCAGEQGLFWQYHDALFVSDSLVPEALSKIAMSLRLNMTKFQTCLDSERSRIAVLKDMQEARRLGVDATPTFIINGKIIRGAPSLKDFQVIVGRELNPAQSTSSNR